MGPLSLLEDQSVLCPCLSWVSLSPGPACPGGLDTCCRPGLVSAIRGSAWSQGRRFCRSVIVDQNDASWLLSSQQVTPPRPACLYHVLVLITCSLSLSYVDLFLIQF